MRVKLILATVFLFLMIIESYGYCQQHNITNGDSGSFQHETGQQIKELKKQIESLHYSFQHDKIDLQNVTKKIRAENKTTDALVKKQVDKAMDNVATLSNQVSNNTSSILFIHKTAATSDWTQRGMFWSSLLLVMVTIMATYLNYRIFRSQTDPDVIVYSTPDPKRSTLINLIIENLGKGVAKNISFSSNRPIPCRAFGLTNQASQPPTMDTGPFIVGIPELGPGSKRVITWGQYHGLLKGLGNEILEITTEYSSRKLFFKQPKFKSTFSLDMKSFEGTDSSGEDWGKMSAESLQSIATSLVTLCDYMKRKGQNNVSFRQACIVYAL